MRALLPLLLAPALVLAGCTGSPPGGGAGDGGKVQQGSAKQAHLVMNTSMGDIRIVLYNDLTPITAGNFLNLTKSGFYNGTRFHRVIDGFMIQDGDPNSRDAANKGQGPPNGWGYGDPGYKISDEFPCADGTVSYTHRTSARGDPCAAHGGLKLKHDKEGLLSMANGGPNTGGSQYFITLAPTPHLDGGHAIFGAVEGGMDVVKAIGKVPVEGPANSPRPVRDVVIHSVTVVSS